VAAGIAAYVLKRYTNWDGLDTFIGLSLIAYVMQCLVYIYMNFEHYFGNYF
jgi:hypothetical protein